MTAQSYLARLQSDGIHLGVKELLQYRQFANLLDLTPRRTPQARLAGSYLTKHKGRGMEFDEARHYQPGDDILHLIVFADTCLSVSMTDQQRTG